VTSEKTMFSVLILTLNEEANIENCINSIKQCDDVVILDSYSDDATEELAIKNGATVHKRKFDDYASQRNYGINDISYKHKWLLMLDADECMTPELLSEINNVLSEENPVALYRMRRKDMFFGTWIKRSGGYPTWFGRLMKIGSVRVERAINEEYHADGDIGYLKEHLIHYPFNNGLSAWFIKHNRYSTMEAHEKLNAVSSKVSVLGLLNKDPTVRRKTVKSLVYKMPGRPLIMFISLYFIKLGFLDGRAGFKFSVLRSIYEYMIDIKVSELKRRNKGFQI